MSQEQSKRSLYLSTISSKSKYFFLFLVISLIQCASQQEKDSSMRQISKVNLLLPICQKTTCSNVFAKLIAFNGCYDWKTDDPNLVQLEKIQKPSDPSGCYSEVYVYTKSKSIKEITYVSAKERHTHEVFKCKVGFAEVSTISIENNFDSINVGDIFELNVLAHDDRGNIFSSLEGWKFNWKIISGHNNAQLIKLTDHGKMEFGDKRESIEKEGFQSDKILIKGSQTGKIVVNVDIIEDNLKDKILSNKRELYVIEPFKIIPDKDVYIVPNTAYNFNLMYINSKKIIPSSDHKYFKWSVSEENCGKIKGFGYFISKNNICTVKVIAKDTRLEQFDTDEVLVHVLYPNNLDIRYLELNEEERRNIEKNGLNKELLNKFNISSTFKLVEGKNYLFKNFLLYDDEIVYFDHKNVKFDFDLSNLNNYVHKGKINFKDNNKLAFLLSEKVTLEDQIIQSSVTLEPNNTLMIKKNVIIYEKVRIKKFGQKFFTLPYLGNFDKTSGQELYLIIRGGTGRYIYFSSNPEIVDTIQDTYLIAKNKGKANIVVFDNEMNSNMDNIDIYVKDINSFNFMEERQEILKGNNFDVTPIALLQNKKYDLDNIFTNCSNIDLNYDLSDHYLVEESYNKNSRYNLNKKYRYYPIRDYINNNIEALTDKLSLINIKNNTEKYEYMNYSNFGICGIDSFKSKEEGLLKILYKSSLHTKNNIKTINSINPSYINIYSHMEIKDIITDNFTKYLLNKNKIENPDTEKNFIITEGSGIELHLTGGISSWNGYQNDYLEDKLVIEYDNNGNTYSADKVSKYFKFVNKKEKIIYAYCYRKGYEFDFVINVHNKRDISLIKPGESKVHFKLSCQNPDHLSMFLLSQTNNFIKTDDFILNEIFNEPQKGGIDYFVKKNSTDIIRIYAFDKNKKIFSNITSLKGEFDKNKKIRNYFNTLDREKIIENPHLYIKDKDIIENIYSLINQEFIQEYVLFNELENSPDTNNKFELKYYLKNKINNQYANIQMIDIPEIYPQNASIYVRETNIYPLTIKKGSGDFSIKLSDETLAKYNYDQNSRKLYITPLRQGILLIKIIDNQLGTGFNYETKSTLYLSDVSRILLYGGGLLMNNKTTTIGIEVYDNFDNKFSPDQQKIIPLRLNETSYGLDYSFSENNTKINITGLIPGLYPIIIKDETSEILSNIATIEVFEKLSVYPPYLLLVPGSEYTLEIIGGPKNRENVQINYQMLDEQIANVSKDYPKVYGAKYGETKLKISLIYKYDYDKIYNINDDKHIINKTDLLCVETVPVRVDFPEKVVIIGAENSRKIYSKSTIRLLAALKKGNEVFTYGTGPFKFEWKIDNPMVAKIRYFLKKELYNKEQNEKNSDNKEEIDQTCDECETMSLIATNIDHNPEKSIGVFLTAIEEGIASISLTVSIFYPSPYTYHKPYQFTTSSKIIINDEIYVDLPGYYGNDLKKTGLYLIPYNIDHELHTNKNSEQIYSIIRQHDINDANNKNAKIISMTDNGRVTSFFRNGLAYISISQLNNKDNNVPVILPILVSEFHSIFIEKTHTIIDMEVGQEMILKIILQHYNGIIFAEKFERLPLKAVVSHPNIANVELIDFNSKLKLKAQNIGDTNIILFHPESRKIYDVFKLNVVQQTTLLNKIVISIGGNINFFGKDLTKKNELSKKGDWISDNPKILKIDKNGYGTAINEGEATVFLKEKNSQKIITSTRVLVRKISRVSFDKTKLPKSFSDIKKAGIEYISEYKVPIILYSYDDEIFTNDEKDKLSIINQKIKIKCESDSPNYVKADEINKDNIHECLFIIRENKYGDIKNKKQAQKPKDIIIQLTVEDYNKNKNSIQESVPFSSSFKIKNNIHNINLSFRDRDYTIYLDNLNDLDIKLSNDRLVKIEKIDREKNSIKIKVPYAVDEDFKGVILYLANVLSGQKEEININYINSGLGGASSGSSLSDFFIGLAFTCTLLSIAYFFIFSERKTPAQIMGNMNYNNYNNFNNNQNMMNMNVNGRGFPSNQRSDYNNANYMSNNRYQSDDIGLRRNFNYSNNNFSDNGSPGFRNNMRSNNYYGQHPRGSVFDNQNYRRFNDSNLNLNNQF